MQQKNTYILGMGSNHQAEQNLLYARQELTERYPDIKFSTVQRTTPIGFTKNRNLFLNQLALLHTSETNEEVSSFLKQLEKECGRTPEDKLQETIKLDLDVLQTNGTPLKAAELERPYYQKALQELLPSD